MITFYVRGGIAEARAFLENTKVQCCYAMNRITLYLCGLAKGAGDLYISKIFKLTHAAVSSVASPSPPSPCLRCPPQLFLCAESLGAVESLAESPAIMTHASVPPEQVGFDDGTKRNSHPMHTHTHMAL